MVDQRAFKLSDGAIAVLATRPGSRESIDVVRMLARSRLSRNLVLLSTLAAGKHRAMSNFDSIAIELLQTAQKYDGEAFARAMTHPQVSCWLSRWTREAREGAVSEDDKDDKVEMCGTGVAIVAAVAAACQVDFTINLPASGHELLLPGLGCALLADDGDAAVTVRRWQGSLVFAAAGSEVTRVPDVRRSMPRWLASRQLHSDVLSWFIDLDDISGFGQTRDAIPCARLDDEAVDKWQKLFSETCQLLASHHAGWADEISTVYRSLSPLQTVDGKSQSVTFVEAFGACALTKPITAVSFAETLVHELQHNKFNAMIEFFPMISPDAEGLYCAPWRPDPRPLDGLLHGIYAFFGVADFWRVQRFVPDSPKAVSSASFHFARWRMAVRAALETALASEYLTRRARLLFSSMQEVVDSWMSEAVPIDVDRAARAAIEVHLASWEARNR